MWRDSGQWQTLLCILIYNRRTKTKREHRGKRLEENNLEYRTLKKIVFTQPHSHGITKRYDANCVKLLAQQITPLQYVSYKSLQKCWFITGINWMWNEIYTAVDCCVSPSLESLRSAMRPALLRGLNFRSEMPANNLIKVINLWSFFKYPNKRLSWAKAMRRLP